MSGFKTRQQLADASAGWGARLLVLDGISAEHMPSDDPELRQAWQNLEAAVAAEQEAAAAVSRLLSAAKALSPADVDTAAEPEPARAAARA
ncbi:hypothetical protein AB0F17_34420 [Nonomuraea sp. NPDC026600]|uniref:hypothetical protein n=1 Tax=Nonomuraea sp. NPDC026600 TaxID=3155363 RepID=UPI0033EF584D